MKQTAVEWLMSQMLAASINKETEEMHITLPKDAFEKAKEMEKEQIMDAFNEGFNEGCRYTTGFEQMLWEDAEQYYNETFKSE